MFDDLLKKAQDLAGSEAVSETLKNLEPEKLLALAKQYVPSELLANLNLNNVKDKIDDLLPYLKDLDLGKLLENVKK